MTGKLTRKAEFVDAVFGINSKFTVVAPAIKEKLFAQMSFSAYKLRLMRHYELVYFKDGKHRWIQIKNFNKNKLSAA